MVIQKRHNDNPFSTNPAPLPSALPQAIWAIFKNLHLSVNGGAHATLQANETTYQVIIFFS